MHAKGEENGTPNGASFIPDQPDPLGLAVTEAVRHRPFTLALRDLFTAIRMFTLIPGVILPVWTSIPQDEFYLGWGPNLFGLVLLSFASVFEVILLVSVSQCFSFYPVQYRPSCSSVVKSLFTSYVIPCRGRPRSGQRRPWIQK
jgi:hypothetical protein